MRNNNNMIKSIESQLNRDRIKEEVHLIPQQNIPIALSREPRPVLTRHLVCLRLNKLTEISSERIKKDKRANSFSHEEITDSSATSFELDEFFFI